MVTIGGASLAKATDTSPKQLNQTKLLVSWGYNPENSAVNQGAVTRTLDAIERGLKVIDIRPMLDPLASKADIWVPIFSGTDCVLALAILNVLIGEDLYDRDFVDHWCEGFDELSGSVSQCTPEWASSITGIEASRIIEVARLMGTVKPMGITIGNGVGDQQNDGHWAVSCICLIEAITGNLGIPGGGGVGPSIPTPLVKTGKIDVLPDRLRPSAEDEANGWMPGVSKLVAPETPCWFQTPKTQESGPTSAYNKALQCILAEDQYPLRFLFAQSTNPLSATRQPKTVRRALEKLDYFVVMDTHWNPSCDYADIVLPACMQYEASEQIGVKNSVDGTFIGINQPWSAPLGESRSDWQYYLDLAVRMGYGDDFWSGSVDAMLEEQLEGSGVSLVELRKKGCLLRKREEAGGTKEPIYRNYAKLFKELPNGKVQCRNTVIGGKPDALWEASLPYLPVFCGPGEKTDEYPILFSDVHAHRLCNHSYYQELPYLEGLEPGPWMLINPLTAKALEVEDCDWVRVESAYGAVTLVARLFKGISPGIAMSKRGWKATDAHRPDEHEVNNLYPDDVLSFDRFHSAMSKQVWTRITKCGEGDAHSYGENHPSKRMEAFVDATISALGNRTVEGGDGRSCNQHGFYLDAFRCIGCWACEVTCRQVNERVSKGLHRRTVVEIVHGEFPDVSRLFVSASCMHCVDPACRKACRFGAISKREEDGLVVADAEKCTGCRACGEACPYGVPRYVKRSEGAATQNRAGFVMDKCDACIGAGGAAREELPDAWKRVQPAP